MKTNSFYQKIFGAIIPSTNGSSSVPLALLIRGARFIITPSCPDVLTRFSLLIQPRQQRHLNWTAQGLKNNMGLGRTSCPNHDRQVKMTLLFFFKKTLTLVIVSLIITSLRTGSSRQ
jgi:hypothetical protein